MATSFTVIDLGQRVKQKYPGAYDDLSDADLGRRVKGKFPGAYDDFVDVVDVEAAPADPTLPVIEDPNVPAGPPPLAMDQVAAGVVTGQLRLHPEDIAAEASLGGMAPPVVRPGVPLPGALAPAPAQQDLGGALAGTPMWPTGTPLPSVARTPVKPALAPGGPPPLDPAAPRSLEAIAAEAERMGARATAFDAPDYTKEQSGYSKRFAKEGLAAFLPDIQAEMAKLPPDEQAAIVKAVGPEKVLMLGAARALLESLTSPEGIALIAATGGAAAGLKQILNAPKLVKLLKQYPTLRRTVDVMAEQAVPAGVAGVGAAGMVEGAPETAKAALEGRIGEALAAGGATLAGGALAVGAGRHAIQRGRAVVARQPGPTTQLHPEGPAVPTSAIGEVEVRAQAARQRARGQNLTASLWDDLIREPAPAGGPIAEGVKYGNRTVRIEQVATPKTGEVTTRILDPETGTREPLTIQQTGRPGYRLVDEATGETVVAGTAETMRGFLRRAGTEPQGGPPLLDPREAQQVVSESTRRAQRAREGQPAPPVAEPRTAQEIMESEGGPRSYPEIVAETPRVGERVTWRDVGTGQQRTGAYLKDTRRPGYVVVQPDDSDRPTAVGLDALTKHPSAAQQHPAGETLEGPPPLTTPDAPQRPVPRETKTKEPVIVSEPESAKSAQAGYRDADVKAFAAELRSRGISDADLAAMSPDEQAEIEQEFLEWLERRAIQEEGRAEGGPPALAPETKAAQVETKPVQESIPQRGEGVSEEVHGGPPEIREGSPYAGDEAEPLLAGARQQAEGHYRGIQAAEARLKYLTKDNQRKEAEAEIAQQRELYEATLSEIRDTFGGEVADRIRSEVEGQTPAIREGEPRDELDRKRAEVLDKLKRVHASKLLVEERLRDLKWTEQGEYTEEGDYLRDRLDELDRSIQFFQDAARRGLTDDEVAELAARAEKLAISHARDVDTDEPRQPSQEFRSWQDAVDNLREGQLVYTSEGLRGTVRKFDPIERMVEVLVDTDSLPEGAPLRGAFKEGSLGIAMTAPWEDLSTSPTPKQLESKGQTIDIRPEQAETGPQHPEGPPQIQAPTKPAQAGPAAGPPAIAAPQPAGGMKSPGVRPSTKVDEPATKVDAPEGPPSGGQFHPVERTPPPSKEAALRAAEFWITQAETSAERILAGRGTTHDERVIHQAPIIAQRLVNFAELGDAARWLEEQKAVDKVVRETLAHTMTGGSYPDHARKEAQHYAPHLERMRADVEALKAGRQPSSDEEPAAGPPDVAPGAPAQKPATVEPEGGPPPLAPRAETEPRPSTKPAGAQPAGAADTPALAGPPPTDVRQPEEKQPTSPQRPAGGRADQPGAPGVAAPGRPGKPGVGTRAPGVGVSARGRRPAKPRIQPGATDRADNSRDYRITDADAIGEGGIRTKAKQNIDAIRLLKQIEAEGRTATNDEKKVLVKYAGWGGMSQVFGYNRDWLGFQEDLKALLTAEEYASARASTPNAHYTSAPVVKAIWRALERLGLEPESVILEPSMGVGHFFGLMAESLYPARRTGVELDTITGRIAKLLYPDSAIHVAGFEDVRLPENFFDVAVSNVPFGNYGVHDQKYKRFPFLTKSIHNYFFAKALDVVRPGGVVAFITSSYTMDSRDQAVREYLSQRTRFLGAIRLPNTTFKATAGTEVTTDIIFLQRVAGADAGTFMGLLDAMAKAPKLEGESWVELSEIKTPDGRPMQINEYFARHPEMMLGRMSLAGTMYADDTPTLEGEFKPEALDEAVNRLPEDVIPSRSVAPEEVGQGGSILDVPDADTIKEGAFALKDGQLVVREGTRYRPAGLKGIAVERVKGQMEVRNAVREVLRTQIHSDEQAVIEKARARLNKVYDAFVKKYGFLSAPANARVFRDDPDGPLLLSLERWDPEKKTAQKTDIFTKRTIERAKPVGHVEQASEALAITLNEVGRIDWARMQELTGKTPDEMRVELGAMVFQDPVGHRWVTADEYLSGNVREKLKVAESAAKADSNFQRNVDALKEVQPEDLGAGDIAARLGASWIGPKDVRQFIASLLGASPQGIEVYYVPQTATWRVVVDDYVRRSAANRQTWGTPRVEAKELIEDALNSKSTMVYDTIEVDGSERRVLNRDQTLLAQDKQAAIKERFSEWIWEDAERTNRLTRLYNDEFNNLQLRQFDGSHLTMPGMARASLENQDLRPHQKNAIWRIVQAGNTLLAHVVGAGKTFTMIGAAMEMKRLGLIHKPMFVVPNHLVEQWAADFYRLYPSANVFVAGREWFKAGKRQQAMSRIATGNWDAVIVAHNSFGRLPMSQESRRRFYQEQLDELESAMEAAREEEGKKSPTVKELEKAKKRLETKLKRLANEESDDNTVIFEELGVDQLFVDEADLFKNLYFVTRMTRLAGLPNSESQRAFDMFLKTQYVERQNGGRGVVFATGTPISNTMAEMFTMQRYLQMPYLEATGLRQFDAWARQFGEAVAGFELAPEGTGYRMNTRFSKFVNVPELMTAFRMVADVQTGDMLKLPVPKLKGGKPKEVVAPSTPELKAVMDDFRERAEAIRGGGVDPHDDNMLKVMIEGRKAALDMRVLDRRSPDHPDSKVNQAVARMHRIWEDTKGDKLTQLVFVDQSPPRGEGPRGYRRGERLQFENQDGDVVTGIVVGSRGKTLTVVTSEGQTVTTSRDNETLMSLEEEQQQAGAWSLYDDIKQKLVALGIPDHEVAFIHDAKTDLDKKRLFDAVNAGKVRVMVGSTEKMGAGMNVQRRLIALHHMDAPWRPRDIEQREGRILRQGNQNEEVQIYTYLQEGSMDAYSWQTLGNKAQFIGQVMTGRINAREVEDVGVFVLTASEFTALSSGDPLIKEKVETDAQVRKLITLRTAHANQQQNVKQQLARIPANLAEAEQMIAAHEQDVETAKNNPKELTLGKRTFTGENARKEAAEALKNVLESWKGVRQQQHIGSYNGFQLWTELRSGDASDLPSLKLQGRFTYHATTTLESLEYHAREDPPRQLAYWNKRKAELEKDRAELTTQAGKPFPQADKLDALLKRQRELADALDINRGDHQVMAPEAQPDPDDDPTPDGDGTRTAAKIVRDVIEDTAGELSLDALGAQLRRAGRIAALSARARKEALFGPRGDATWLNLAWHTPRYVGEKFPAFMAYVDRAAAAAEEREELAHRLGQILEPYFRLADSKRKQLDSRLIDARFAGDQDIDQHGLDAEQLTAFRAVRHAMATALNWLADLVVDITSGGRLTSAQSLRSLEDVVDALEAAGLEEEQIDSLAEKVWKILEEIRDASAKGYVPFSRFGRWTYGIYPTAQALERDPNLQPIHEQRETAEAASARFDRLVNTPRYRRLLDSGQYVARRPQRQEKADREFLRQLGGFEIGILSKIAQLSPQFAESMGVAPEELQQFAESIQKLTQRLGFRAHFIQSQLTPGFERDLARPLADYTLGISRHIANAKMFRDFTRLARHLPKHNLKLNKYVTDYVDYLRSAPGEAAWARSFLFHWFLGVGNPMAAIVNLTQPMMMTAPWMLQYGSPKEVGEQILKAYRDVWAAVDVRNLQLEYAKLPADVRDDARGALEDGTLKAQTAQELHGIARRRSQSLTKVERASTFLFSGSEHINRLVSFIAMNRLWTAHRPSQQDHLRVRRLFARRDRTHGLPLPYFATAREFAEHGVRITQLEYARYNKPALFRHWYGSLLGVFKMFMVGQLELGMRLYRSQLGGAGPDPENLARQKMAFLAWITILVAAAGLLGLPFVKMAMEIGEYGWKKATGKEADWEQEFHDFLKNLTTAEIGDALAHGASWLTPFDLSRSLAMDDPAGLGRAIETGELLPSVSAALSIPGKVGEGLGELAAGEGQRALKALAPRTVRGVVQASQLATEGLRTRAGGKMVAREEFRPHELVGAAMSVPLTRVSRAYEDERRASVLRTANQEQKSRLVRRLAKAIEERDEPAKQQAIAAIREYNARNADKITNRSIDDAVKHRLLPADKRRLLSLPQGQRRQYRERLEGGPPPLDDQ